MCTTVSKSTRQEIGFDTASWRNAIMTFSIFTGVLAASIALPLPAANGEIGHMPALCPFFLATGLPCPGCGLTRAFVCIGHGRLSESLHWHPLGLLVYLSFVVLWAYYGLYVFKRERPYFVPPRVKSILGYGAVVLLVGTGFLRIAWIVATHHNPF